MRRLWNLLGGEGEGEKQPHGDRTKEDGSDGEDAVEVTNTGTQTMSREEIKEETGTPVKSKKKKKMFTRSSEAITPKKSTNSTGKKKKGSKEERKKKGTPVKKISEARDENKADDEEFENDGVAPMAKSKIKTRDLKWKESEESPQKTERSSEDNSQTKTGRRKNSLVTEKICEAREENKADDEEFENDGKATMAKSKIKTRDLKWKSNEHGGEISPGKTGSGSDSGGESTEHKEPRKKKKPLGRPTIAEARDENKADDEEFENAGTSMARSKIKTRNLKWKEEEKESPKKIVVSEAREVNKEDDEEFENGSGATMAKSKIKTRDLKWKKEDETRSPIKPAKSMDGSVDSSEARSPIKIVEARDENKADDEEFENAGASMARSKIKSRDLQWKKDEASPAKGISSQERTTAVIKQQKTPEKKTADAMKPSSESPEPPPRSLMQMIPTERSRMLPPSPAPSTERSRMLPPSPAPSPSQSSVRKDVKEEVKVEKSEVSRSRHSKKEGNSRENADKSFIRNLRPRLSLSRKSKSRSDKTGVREVAKKEDASHSDSMSSQMCQPSPDKSSRERTSSTSSSRLDVAASAVDKSMKSIKSMFKKTEEGKKKMEDLLPHVERDARDVQDARRLMEILKRNNVFENVLFPYQNDILREHFTSGSRRLDQETMDLLFKATDFVLDKILYRGEELDEYIDNPLKTFILNRTKSRTMVVEHLLRHPEFLPQTWGGRTVVLMRSEEEVTVAPEDEKSTRSKKEGRKK